MDVVHKSPRALGDQVTGFTPLDSNFGSTNAAARAIAIQPNGRVVISGRLHDNSKSRFLVCRTRFDGTLDKSFNKSGWREISEFGNQTFSHSISVDNAGRIIAVGQYQQPNKSELLAITRLLPNGKLDESLNAPWYDGSKIPGTVVYDLAGTWTFARSVVISHDGGIIVGGYSKDSGTNYRFCAMRLTPNGLPEPSFASGGLFKYSFPNGDSGGLAAVNSPTGEIYLIGSAMTPANCRAPAVIRISTAGKIDWVLLIDKEFNGQDTKSFGADVDDEGRLLISGATYERSVKLWRYFVARVTSNGVPDPTFNSGKASYIHLDNSVGFVASDPNSGPQVGILGSGSIAITGLVQTNAGSQEQIGLVVFDPSTCTAKHDFRSAGNAVAMSVRDDTLTVVGRNNGKLICRRFVTD